MPLLYRNYVGKLDVRVSTEFGIALSMVFGDALVVDTWQLCFSLAVNAIKFGDV